MAAKASFAVWQIAKRRGVFALLLALLTAGTIVDQASAAVRLTGEGRVMARHARDLKKPADETSNLIRLDVIQKAKFTPTWSAEARLHEEIESIYATDPDRYGATLRDRESFRVWPGETWVGYDNGETKVKLGYQTVVWGEAFGTAYADIINPKDYREQGLGELRDLRRPIPMLNMQRVGETWSVQLLWLPVADHHWLPTSGSEFAPGFTNLTIEESAPEFRPGDFGAKIGFRIGDADFSLFYLSAADRTPVYSLLPTALPAIRLKPEYRALRTAGLTFTNDLELVLLRAEVVGHFGRAIQESGARFGQTKDVDELVYVIGVDFPSVEVFQLGLQYSELVLPEGDYLFRKKRESLLATRLARTFTNDVSAELLAGFRTDEAGVVLQGQIRVPLSPRSEFIFGVDAFEGPEETSVGALRDASRYYVKFIGYLRG